MVSSVFVLFWPLKGEDYPDTANFSSGGLGFTTDLELLSNALSKELRYDKISIESRGFWLAGTVRNQRNLRQIGKCSEMPNGSEQPFKMGIPF